MPKSPPNRRLILTGISKSVHAEDSRKDRRPTAKRRTSRREACHGALSPGSVRGRVLAVGGGAQVGPVQAAQTAARRAWRRRTHTHEEVSSEDDEDDEASLKTAATAGRLAALAGALAPSKEVESLDRKRVAQELLAVASSDHREASRAAAQALRVSFPFRARATLFFSGPRRQTTLVTVSVRWTL